MAYIRKLPSGRYRVEVEKLGVRDSETFDTKAEARNWGAMREAEVMAAGRGADPRRTLQDAIDRYLRDVSTKKDGERFETMRLLALGREFPDLVKMRLVSIDSDVLGRWRDARLAGSEKRRPVTGSTVQREINLLRNVFSVAREEWKWISHKPFEGMRMPDEAPPRTRRVAPGEVRRLVRHLGYRTGDVRTKQQQVALAFLVALRTALREGEIAGLTDADVDLDRRVVTLGRHKTVRRVGARRVPITRQGARLLRPLYGRGGRLFDVSADSISTLFRRAVAELLIDDLHFHDSRAEALTRLSRKVDPMTLARISGHKDLRILMDTYYRESAEDIARRL